MSARYGWKRPDTLVSIAAVVVTLAAIAWMLACGSPASRAWVKGLWAVWVILPPAWFLLEWSIKGPKDEDEPEKHPHAIRGDKDVRAERFELLRYSQELASKFWLAGVTVLSAALYYYGGLPPK